MSGSDRKPVRETSTGTAGQVRRFGGWVYTVLVMAAVLIVRPWGLLGKAEAPARRTPGLTVNP